VQGRGRGRISAALAATIAGLAMTTGAASALPLPKLPVDPPSVPPLPKLPQLPKAPSLPSAPGAPAPETPSLPRLAPPPALGGGGGAGGSAPVGGTGSPVAGSTGQGGSGAATSNRSASAGAGATRSRAASTRQSRARSRRARRELRLRRSLRHLEPCLFAVSGFVRRVIVLRAGLGGRRPLSRAGVARRLDTSVGRVRGAERRGLRSMRGAKRSHGCLANGSASTVIVTTAPAEAAGVPALVRTDEAGTAELAAASGSEGSGKRDAKADGELPSGGVLGQSGSSNAPPPRASVRPTAATADSGIPAVALALGLAALALIAVAGSTIVLSRRRHDEPVAAGPQWSTAATSPPPWMAQPEEPRPAESPPPWMASLRAARAGERAQRPPLERVAAAAGPHGARPAQRKNGAAARTAVGVAASVVAGLLLRRRRR
jgi:hypothetical protein